MQRRDFFQKAIAAAGTIATAVFEICQVLID